MMGHGRRQGTKDKREMGKVGEQILIFFSSMHTFCQIDVFFILFSRNSSKSPVCALNSDKQEKQHSGAGGGSVLYNKVELH